MRRGPKYDENVEKLFWEIYENKTSGAAKNIVFESMIRYASDKKKIDRMVNFKWKSIDFSESEYKLVLSDSPVRKFFNNDVVSGVMLPLSPDILFMAAEEEYFLNLKLKKQFLPAFAFRHVEDQFKRCRKFVIAKDMGPDDLYMSFAERFIHKLTGAVFE